LVNAVKEIKQRVLSELMMNSRRSDRQLARAIGTSQPTVTRVRRKLEKEGYIREYTTIPDFVKLDYKILAFTVVKLKQKLSPERIEQAKSIITESMKTLSLDVLMLERGLGLDSDGVIISCHKGYSGYVEFVELLKKFGGEFLSLENTKNFLIDLQDEVRFIPLTLSILAHNIALAE
jgi:DNA-binding Lrp family transcriptional regulator